MCRIYNPSKYARESSSQKTYERHQPRIGIIGAGATGLFSALLLKEQGMDIKILEANPSRVGGRIYTVDAENDNRQYQYGEAGAMRLPFADENLSREKQSDHHIVYQLIDHLNKEYQGDIQRMRYLLADPKEK
jgi:monoamine oxidase